MLQPLRIYLLICLLVFPQASAAAPSSVQTGEHDGFTRLVASFPEQVTWRVEKDGGTVVLQLEGHDEGFDITGAFDRITKERLARLVHDENTLTLMLGCDCDVAAFAVGTQYVAIDILSKGVETDLPLLREKEGPEKSMSAVTTDQVTTTMRAAPDPATVPVRPPSGAALPREELSNRELELLNEVQKQLVQEVGGAATRGILDEASKFSLPKVPQLQAETSNLDDHLENQNDLPKELPDTIRNVRISNSMDVPAFTGSDTKNLSDSGVLCTNDDDVSVGSWGGQSDFHTQIGDARTRLFGEFDRLDPEVALQLAKTYIYHGFGAEARQVLMLDPELSQENRILIGISDILEDGKTEEVRYFRSMLACKADIALWAYLAKDTLDFPGSLDPAPALLALNRLPTHLRKFLAPELSRRLLEHGDSEAAALALRSVERLPEPMSTAGRYAQAEVSLDAGQTDKAKAQLEDVIDDNAAQSPEALIALVDAQMEENQPISHETAGLIEAYAQELRETELGPELRRAHVLALAKSGQFDRAFFASHELGGDENDPASVSLRSRLVKETTESADDIVFLDHMFRLSGKQVKMVPLATKLKIAERYLALGFGAAAQNIIDMIPDGPTNRTRQILAARIALNLERPALARAALLGLEGEDEDLLRAQAQRMSGGLEEAHHLYKRADNPQDAVTSAWLANNWQSLTPDETPVFGPVAVVAAQAAVDDPAYDGMLARTSDALKESMNARQVLLDLLTAPELQVDQQDPDE